MKQIFSSGLAFFLRFRVSSSGAGTANFCKLLFLLCLLPGALMISSFQRPLLQTATTKERHVKSLVPFKGKIRLDVSNGIVGTGEASHIGQFDVTADDDESNFPFITGTVTITAANGDQLFATHTGNAQDLGGGMLRVTFDNMITGGSGRFAGASGSFTLIATVNENTGTAMATIDGSIQY